MADVPGSAGSVATLVGAALETAGYHTQAQLLDIFNGAFGTQLAALLYLFAIVTAIVIIAIGGSYRYGLWLLVGPPIFTFLISYREPIQPAQWRFGDKTYPQSRVLEGARGLADGEADVSVFFKVWNELVSGIIQELISLLKITEKGGDADFLNKNYRYFNVWQSQVVDPQLKNLVNRIVLGRCGQYFYLLKTSTDPYVDPSRREGAKKVLENWGKNNKYFNLEEHQDVAHYLRQVYGFPLRFDEKYTCDEMWQLAVDVFKRGHAEIHYKQMVNAALPEGLSHEQAEERLGAKFKQRIDNGGTIEERNASRKEIINEITGRMLAKEFWDQSRSLAGSSSNQQAKMVNSRDKNGGWKEDLDTTRMLMNIAGGDEYQHRGELIGVALTLPYIQGMVLYFLSLAFPFFALLVVIPGRETGLLLWMSLWVWIKLWDFGIGVVMMLDNVLYAMHKHGEPVTDEILKKPDRLFAVLNQADPTWGSYMYFNILACTMFAVPILTGMLVSKGGSELVSAVSGGLKTFPDFVGHSYGSFQRALMLNEKNSAAQDYISSRVMGKAFTSLTGDKAVMAAFSSKVANQVGGEVAKQAARDLASGTFFKSSAGAKVLGAIGAEGVVGSIMQARAEVYGAEAASRLEYDLLKEGYDAANSEYVRELGSDGVALRWNSHDFRRNFPANSALSVLQSMTADFQAGRASDSIMDSVIKRGLGAGGSAPIAPKRKTIKQ